MRRPSRPGPRAFDAVAVGNRETDAWVSYYRHEWGRFLAASVGMVGSGFGIDPARASQLEVEWWRLHRAHQYHDGADADQLQASLVNLYAYVYGAEVSTMQEAARWRVHAMDLSDRWVAAGCHRDDPLLLEQRRALVASYAALRDAASRSGQSPSVEGRAARGLAAHGRAARRPTC